MCEGVVCIYCGKLLPCSRSAVRRHLKVCVAYRIRVEGRVVPDE